MKIDSDLKRQLIEPLLQDAFCVRIIAASVNENRTDKLLAVLDSLMPNGGI